MSTIRQALIAAHRAGDEEAMRQLSQAREAEKNRQRRHCARCGSALCNWKCNVTGLCRLCLTWCKHYAKGIEYGRTANGTT